MRIRPEKLIVTSNYLPEQCFPNREDIAPIMRRFQVVEDLSDLPPILEGGPQEVVLEVLEAGEELHEVQGAEEVLHEAQYAGEVFLQEEEVDQGGQVQPEPPLVQELIEESQEQEDAMSGQDDSRCNHQ